MLVIEKFLLDLKWQGNIETNNENMKMHLPVERHY